MVDKGLIEKKLTQQHGILLLYSLATVYNILSSFFLLHFFESSFVMDLSFHFHFFLIEITKKGDDIQPCICTIMYLVTVYLQNIMMICIILGVYMVFMNMVCNMVYMVFMVQVCTV